MRKNDLIKLADEFVSNAIQAQSGNNVWIEYNGNAALPLASACSDKVKQIGADATLFNTGSELIKRVTADQKSLKEYGDFYLERMKEADCYIRVRDDADLKKAGADLLTQYSAITSAAVDYRVDNTRWVVLSAPTAAFARACGMSGQEFDRFYVDACCVNYKAMEIAADPLQDLLREGKDVEITGVGTRLEFSIEDISAVKCVGLRNRPDGEVFTAPVKNSIYGHVAFGPSVYMGERFNSLDLKIVAGRIEEAKAHNALSTRILNKILDMDEGARYFGEFAIAFNPKVREPVGDILFDEKIDGSFHMAAGQCYDETSNGNKSAVHWDMVKIQRPEYGGGEIIIDGRVIRKDGCFVLPELKGLNPEMLL